MAFVRCSHCGERFQTPAFVGDVPPHRPPGGVEGCPGVGRPPLDFALRYYSRGDIDRGLSLGDYRFAKMIGPGWYAFDGPEGDEVSCGPFPDPRSAVDGVRVWGVGRRPWFATVTRDPTGAEWGFMAVALFLSAMLLRVLMAAGEAFGKTALTAGEMADLTYASPAHRRAMLRYFQD